MKSISYTGIVLTEESRNNLIAQLNNTIDESWEILAHHTTMNMGACKDADVVGSLQEIIVTGIRVDNEIGVMAVKVMTNLYSDNAIKHITVAIDRAGGAKPFHSNKIKDHEYQMVEPIRLLGVVEEVSF